MRGGHDAMLRQIAGLVDAGMLGEIARGCDDHAPHVAADPNGHHGAVRQLGDAQGDVDPFLNQIGVAVEQDEIDRYGREGFQIGIDDGTLTIFPVRRAPSYRWAKITEVRVHDWIRSRKWGLRSYSPSFLQDP
jgi:hypothetical protein